VYWQPRSALSRVRLNADAGSQYTAIHYGETLMLEGLIPSVGTVGDVLDNALCEKTIGLYKTECIRTRPNASARAPRSAPGRFDDVRQRRPRPSTTLDSTPESTPVTRNEVCMKPGMLQSPRAPRHRPFRDQREPPATFVATLDIG
jgi:transposase InsO family protein